MLSRGGTVVTYVITEACIGTKNTACVGVCPVEAIYPDDEVPEDMQHYITKATEFDYSRIAPGFGAN
jgi:ferredoxin